MLRKLYKRNVDGIKKMIENFTTTLEIAEKNARALAKVKNGKEFQIVRGSVSKDGLKSHSGSIYLLYHPKQTLLSKFLNPQLLLQPKFLLWNTLKRQVSTSERTGSLTDSQTRNYPRRVRKIGRTQKPFHYSDMWQKYSTDLNSEEHIPRCDDLHFAQNMKECKQSWNDTHWGVPPMIQNEEHIGTDVNEDLLFPLVIRVIRPKQQNNHRLWKRDIKSFEFTKLCPPTPSFADRQRRKFNLNKKQISKENRSQKKFTTLAKPLNFK